MLKKILPLMFVLMTTVIASVAGLAMEARSFYLPDKEEENVSVEYYCTEKNEIIVVFGKEQMEVVWVNSKTQTLENLKCEDFKEWAESENILKDLEVIEEPVRI